MGTGREPGYLEHTQVNLHVTIFTNRGYIWIFDKFLTFYRPNNDAAVQSQSP